MEESIRRAKCLYDQNKGSTFLRAWVYNKKEKMEKIRNGFKPHFLRNNSQG
jgi:hypothetical protein